MSWIGEALACCCTLAPHCIASCIRVGYAFSLIPILWYLGSRPDDSPFSTNRGAAELLLLHLEQNKQINNMQPPQAEPGATRPSLCSLPDLSPRLTTFPPGAWFLTWFLTNLQSFNGEGGLNGRDRAGLHWIGQDG